MRASRTASQSAGIKSSDATESICRFSSSSARASRAPTSARSFARALRFAGRDRRWRTDGRVGSSPPALVGVAARGGVRDAAATSASAARDSARSASRTRA